MLFTNDKNSLEKLNKYGLITFFNILHIKLKNKAFKIVLFKLNTLINYYKDFFLKNYASNYKTLVKPIEKQPRNTFETSNTIKKITDYQTKLLSH